MRSTHLTGQDAGGPGIGVMADRFFRLAFLSIILTGEAGAQTVANVRSQQLQDGTKRVEVLYDLAGAVSAGATVTIAFSDDSGNTFSIHPVASTLSGDIGSGVGNGTNRRVLWNANASLPPGTHGATYRAAITATNDPAQPPRITSFTAIPSAINSGQSSMLAWTSTGGTSASLDNGIGPVATSGSTSVAPTVSTTYRLTVTGAGGAATGTATVSVSSPEQPRITSFTATPPTISAGQSSTLAWTSTGGVSASLDNGIGSVAPSGSTSVAPTVSTTYRLTVTGAGGTATGTATLNVSSPEAPRITSFTATPSTITGGQSSTLTWTSTGGVSALLDNQVVATNGSQTVSPATTKTYSLVVSNAVASATQQTTVTVTGLSPDCHVPFTFTPENLTVRSTASTAYYTASAGASTYWGCGYQLFLPTIRDGSGTRIIYPALSPTSLASGSSTALLFKLAGPPPGVYPLTIHLTNGLSSGVPFFSEDFTVTLTVVP